MDAPSGALAGGIGNGGVSAGAGGDNLHIAAANVIGGSIAEHCSVIHIGNMHGNCAANAQLGQKPIGGMACLGNGFGGCVQGLGFDAEILCPDSAVGNAGLVAVHHHLNGNRYTDGILGSCFQAKVGTALAQNRRRAVQGAVCTQIGNAAAGGLDNESRGSDDALSRIHLCKIRIVKVHNTQRANSLIDTVSPSPCRCGGVLEDAADAVGVGAGNALGGLAGKTATTHQLAKELNSVENSHLILGGQIVKGNGQRHGAGSHIREGIYCHIILGGNNGLAANDGLRRVEHKVACNEHAGLGFHIPHDGGLAGGVAGGVHDAGSQNLQSSACINAGTVGDLRGGVKLHHSQGDGESGGAAHGVGHQVICGAGTDEDARLPLAAVSGDQVCHLADGHPGMSGGNCHGKGNGHLQQFISGIDGDVHIGAGMDVAACVEIAVDGDIGIAELQDKGIKVLAGGAADNVFTGNESLVEDELCAQVDDLLCHKLLVFRNHNVDIPVGFVESKLDVNIGIGIQIILYDAGFKSNQCLVLAVGGEEDVLCPDGAKDVDLLADYQKVQSVGVQTVDTQLSADGLAQVIC